ncbi:MAG: PQQ-dependent sugar dehydrogenase [Acidimicrobiales bacterium]
MRRSTLVLAIAGSAVSLTGLTACPPTVTPGAPAFTVTTAVSGLDHPWEVAFTPDGTMLVTERAGRIDAVVGGVKGVLAAPADVVSTSEGGMLGLAVDPAFATNRRIYACFESNASGSLDERVAGFTVSADYTSLSGRTDIVTGIPLNNTGNPGRHSGCRLRFGPDNALWITTGDGVRSDTAQNMQSLGGKILRVTTTGAPAPGNPFAPGTSKDPRIFTLGHRNVQGLSFRPSDGRAFSIEQGTNCDDEVNLPVAGANFGWNPGASGTYDEFAPMTDTASVPGATAARWSSGCPTIATSGGSFVTGSQWGSWDGALVAAALAGTQLRVLQFDAAGTLLSQSTALTDRGRLRTVTQGPNGHLYVPTDANPGVVLELTPA